MWNLKCLPWVWILCTDYQETTHASSNESKMFAVTVWTILWTQGFYTRVTQMWRQKCAWKRRKAVGGENLKNVIYKWTDRCAEYFRAYDTNTKLITRNEYLIHYSTVVCNDYWQHTHITCTFQFLCKNKKTVVCEV